MNFSKWLSGRSEKLEETSASSSPTTPRLSWTPRKMLPDFLFLYRGVGNKKSGFRRHSTSSAPTVGGRSPRDDLCMLHGELKCQDCEEVNTPVATPKEALRILRTRFIRASETWPATNTPPTRDALRESDAARRRRTKTAQAMWESNAARRRHSETVQATIRNSGESPQRKSSIMLGPQSGNSPMAGELRWGSPMAGETRGSPLAGASRWEGRGGMGGRQWQLSEARLSSLMKTRVHVDELKVKVRHANLVA